MDELELGTKIIRTAVVTITFFLISAFIVWRVTKPLKSLEDRIPEKKALYDEKMKAYENAVLLISGLESKLNLLLTEFEKIGKDNSPDCKATKSKKAVISHLNKADKRLGKLAPHFEPEVQTLIEDLRKSTELASQSAGIFAQDQENFKLLQKQLNALTKSIFKDGHNHFSTLSTSATN
ncbi:hypothetical protein [Microbulbifer variabilis]|uniref:Uncharacterized protein n=1 Tax=Microbulbifer variabilis TaxID=266805 RepID=A0ABY4V789_9GAMM|nr:hypothetical protein [Microbulbifer variabilis]USD20129.1 hypothetical protein MJO52_13685 [Microbulbifer variabilis]